MGLLPIHFIFELSSETFFSPLHVGVCVGVLPLTNKIDVDVRPQFSKEGVSDEENITKKRSL